MKDIAFKTLAAFILLLEVRFIEKGHGTKLKLRKHNLDLYTFTMIFFL